MMPDTATRLRRSDWLVDVCALMQADDLVKRLHYAAGGANTATFRHGLYRREDWPLVVAGVAWWIPPTRTAATATFPEGEWQRVLALSRFVLEPDVPKNGASSELRTPRDCASVDGPQEKP